MAIGTMPKEGDATNRHVSQTLIHAGLPGRQLDGDRGNGGAWMADRRAGEETKIVIVAT